jgi:hypothetical protein
VGDRGGEQPAHVAKGASPGHVCNRARRFDPGLRDAGIRPEAASRPTNTSDSSTRVADVGGQAQDRQAKPRSRQRHRVRQCLLMDGQQTPTSRLVFTWLKGKRKTRPRPPFATRHSTGRMVASRRANPVGTLQPNRTGLNTFKVGSTRDLCTSPAVEPTRRRACYQPRRKARNRARGKQHTWAGLTPARTRGLARPDSPRPPLAT